jgi:hypothetical protein
VNALEENRRHLFHDALAWKVHLSVLKIGGPRHRQIATEVALFGALAASGLHEQTLGHYCFSTQSNQSKSPAIAPSSSSSVILTRY